MTGTNAVVYDELTRRDAARCAELEAQLFDGDDPWPEVAFVREVAASHNTYVAARVGDTLVGYAGIARLGRTPRSSSRSTPSASIRPTSATASDAA